MDNISILDVESTDGSNIMNLEESWFAINWSLIK